MPKMAKMGVEEFVHRNEGWNDLKVPGPQEQKKPHRQPKTEPRDEHDDQAYQAGPNTQAPFFGTDTDGIDDSVKSHATDVIPHRREQGLAHDERDYQAQQASGINEHLMKDEFIQSDEASYDEGGERGEGEPYSEGGHQRYQHDQFHGTHVDPATAREAPPKMIDGNNLGHLDGDSYPDTTSGNPTTADMDEAEHGYADWDEYSQPQKVPISRRGGGARPTNPRTGGGRVDGGQARPITTRENMKASNNNPLLSDIAAEFAYEAAPNPALARRGPPDARNAPQPQHNALKDATQAFSQAIHHGAPKPAPAKRQHDHTQETTQVPNAARQGALTISQPRVQQHSHKEAPLQLPNAAYQGPSTTIQSRGPQYGHTKETAQTTNAAFHGPPTSTRPPDPHHDHTKETMQVADAPPHGPPITTEPRRQQQVEHNTERVGTANQSLQRAPQDQVGTRKQRKQKANAAATSLHQTQAQQLPLTNQNPVADQQPTNSGRGSESRDEHAHSRTPPPVELDYDNDELFKMNYEDLKGAPFDKDPRRGSFEVAFEHDSLEIRMAAVANLDKEARREFLASLTIEQWEDAGDWFLQRFAEIAKKFKGIRREKRKFGEDFEDKVEKRHHQVSKKTDITTNALALMKQHGAQVLESTPKKMKKTK